MNNSTLETTLKSAQFKKLVSKRWTISIILTAVMLAVYFGFILLIAFDKDVLASKIGDHITLGLPVGLGIILFAWMLTGIYVNWANNVYDKEVEVIKNQISEAK
jgi:uncharacterized membrane protein (DUF485 family)